MLNVLKVDRRNFHEKEVLPAVVIPERKPLNRANREDRQRSTQLISIYEDFRESMYRSTNDSTHTIISKIARTWFLRIFYPTRIRRLWPKGYCLQVFRFFCRDMRSIGSEEISIKPLSQFGTKMYRSFKMYWLIEKYILQDRYILKDRYKNVPIFQNVPISFFS